MQSRFVKAALEKIWLSALDFWGYVQIFRIVRNEIFSWFLDTIITVLNYFNICNYKV